MLALTVLKNLVNRGTIPPTRAKDIRTSLNKLAEAYGVAVEDLDLTGIEATYADTLKTYFAGLQRPPSVHTIRNTSQNVKQLLAHAPSPVTRRNGTKAAQRHTRNDVRLEFIKSSPYKTHYTAGKSSHYMVPMEQWPADIRLGWQIYAADKSLEVRQVTLEHYRTYFAEYVSYNLAMEAVPLTRWDHVFEPDRIKRCVAWMAARVKANQISMGGEKIIITLVDIAQHQERPEYVILQKLKRRMAKPAKVFDKKRPRHTVSLADLDQVGSTLMAEGRQPISSAHGSGIYRAVTFQTGLIIRFLVRCPRRSREVRELDLDGRLYRDEAGIWQLHYRSDQLKIAEHDGAPNEFRMAWPADLVPDLEEYLQTFRPRLPNSATNPVVFLGGKGNPLTGLILRNRISLECYRLLQKHVYPHLFRTLWCDAYLDRYPGDWEGAAAMLNDTPQTIQSWYRQFRVEQHLKKAIDFNARLFGNGKRTSP